MTRDGKAKTMRVAIYCRQSVERAGKQEMTSVQAQRAAVEAYVASQKGSGWSALPEQFNDEGYSGKNVSRPAFQRLMALVKAREVDVVACYKVDRISRSLLDFASIMRTLDDHDVDFVSVTQSFDTSNPIGKLTLNLLMSFSEFEREVISERLRDKAAAARRAGLWGVGGAPFGYDHSKGRLTVNENEAPIVRLIFELYLQLRSLSLVATELKRRAITSRTGRRWTPTALSRVLRSVPVIGRVPLGDESFPGKHERILDDETFEAAQALLAKNGTQKGSDLRNKYAVLLRGLLHCAQCDRPMVHTYSAGKRRRFHYYVCRSSQLNRDDACPGTRVRTAEIEGFVVDKISAIGRDPAVLLETFRAANELAAARAPKLDAEIEQLRREHRKLDRQRENLLKAIESSGNAAGSIGRRLAEIEGHVARVEERTRELRAERAALDHDHVDEEDIRTALENFDELWKAMNTDERVRTLNLLIERIDYDGYHGEIEVAYREAGIAALSQEAITR